MQKPDRLRKGDIVAVLSPSWGGPSLFPHVFDLGLRNLESLFDLRTKEYPTARMEADELYRNPEARADDINRAFADPEVKAIVASIGGDDSVRILPFLDVPQIVRSPKILMGFSDTTTLTTYLNWHGLVTFNGPSVMAGFAQMRHLPETCREHVRQVLMDPAPTLELRPYEKWSDRYVDWNTTGYSGDVGDLKPNDEGWQWLQGTGVASGPLFGGCIDVLEFMKGTRFWPPEPFWDGKVLFLESSEDRPTVAMVKYMLRNYGSMGVLDRVTGLLYGRARSYTDAEKTELYAMIRQVVAEEFGRPDLPIVANVDFGHTEPQWLMPLGIPFEIDCRAKRLRFLEAAVE
jgi:muramoyltetrapeptide carboxypeptidase LdcA involved in peptidoglycan recycling